MLSSTPQEYIIKKSARSNSTENHKPDISIGQNADTDTIRNGRKKERSRIGDKKYSHMYIDKNLSYSPSIINAMSKNSQTPSLLIRNNLRHIDKVTPYPYNNKSRNLYTRKYNILNSNHSASNRVNEQDYLEYSPYKKYVIKTNKNQQVNWKLEQKKRLATNVKQSSIISRSNAHKIKLPNLANKGIGK